MRTDRWAHDAVIVVTPRVRRPWRKGLAPSDIVAPMLKHRRSSHHALAALVAAGALAAAALPGTASAADSPVPAAKAHAAAEKTGCLRARTALSRQTTKQAQQSVACLLNRERRLHGLPIFTKFISGRTLDKSALAHVRNGVATRSWTDWQHSHMEPGAAGDFATQVTNRIRATGYCAGGNSWKVAEITYNDTNATPLKAVTWWMNDPPHRDTILDATLKGVGVGVARGLGDPTFTVGKDSAAFVADFGTCNGAAKSV